MVEWFMTYKKWLVGHYPAGDFLEHLARTNCEVTTEDLDWEEDIHG